jgi:hypothetical protein
MLTENRRLEEVTEAAERSGKSGKKTEKEQTQRARSITEKKHREGLISPKPSIQLLRN